MTKPPIPTPVYHITPVHNLLKIFQARYLLAKVALDQADIGYTDIAHQNIQDRRSTTSVPCGPGGTLHDYVPFYFGPRSPMLYTIYRSNVKGFSGTQADIVHLVSSVQKIAGAGFRFVFTDGHGIMTLTDFFDDLSNLDQIDWPLMASKYWADTVEDPDRKRRRQAEFLVYERFPIELVEIIGVMNQAIQNQVQRLFAASGFAIPVKIQRNWYY